MVKKLLLAFLLLLPSVSCAQPTITLLLEDEISVIAYDADVMREADIAVTDIYTMFKVLGVSTDGKSFNMLVDLYAVNCRTHQQAIRTRRVYLDMDKIDEIDMGGAWFDVKPGSVGAVLERALCDTTVEPGLRV